MRRARALVRIASLPIALGMGATACSHRTVEKMRSHPRGASNYSATLIETESGYGAGNRYRLRLDAAAQRDDGWFFVDALNTDLVETPRPELRWASPNDLIVMVHTARIEGRTTRRFGGDGRPPGSLTIQYVADQPRQ